MKEAPATSICGPARTSPRWKRVKKELSDKSRESKKNWATARQDKGGKQFCKPLNDSRGCKQWCPKKQEPACDVILPNGKVRAPKTHNRIKHVIAQRLCPQLIR